MKLFAPYEWSDHAPWGEDIPCSSNTAMFINAVNEINIKRSEDEKGRKKFSYLSQIDTPEKMKEALLEVLKEDNPTDTYWREMNELVEQFAENKVLEASFSLIAKAQLSVAARAKFMHLKDVYEEHCYHLCMWREAEREAKEQPMDFYGDA